MIFKKNILLYSLPFSFFLQKIYMGECSINIPAKVKNTIIIKESCIIHNNFTASGNLLEIGSLTCNNDTSSPIDITFDNTSNIYINNIDTYSGENPFYLVLDTSNKIYKTRTLPSGDLTVETLTASSITSKGNQMNIATNGGTITIGNTSSQISFLYPITGPKTGYSTASDYFVCNGNVLFNLDIQASKPFSLQNGLCIIGVGSEYTGNIVVNSTSDISFSEPLLCAASSTLGNSNMPSTIIITNSLSTASLTLGSQDSLVNSISELSSFSGTPALYLFITDEHKVVSGNGGIVSINPFQTNEINTKEIKINNDSNNQVIFNGAKITINTDNATFFSHSNPLVSNINTSCTLNNDFKCIFNTLDCSTFNIQGGDLTVDSSNSITINNIYTPQKSTGESSNNKPFDQMYFNFKKYFFKNLYLLEKDLIEYSFGVLPKDGEVTLMSKPKNYLLFSSTKKPSSSPSPVSYTYSDSYTIRNNDICPKRKRKMYHYGFIAEELAETNIEEIAKYDHYGNIFDYDENIIRLYYFDIVSKYEKKLQYLKKILSFLSKNLENKKEIFEKYKKNFKKNFLKYKKNLYRRSK